MDNATVRPYFGGPPVFWRPWIVDPFITLMSPDPRLTPANPLPPLSRPLRRILDPAATALPLAPMPPVCCVSGFWILDCGLYPLERPGFWILYPGPSTSPRPGGRAPRDRGLPYLGSCARGRPPSRPCDSRTLDPGPWLPASAELVSGSWILDPGSSSRAARGILVILDPGSRTAGSLWLRRVATMQPWIPDAAARVISI